MRSINLIALAMIIPGFSPPGLADTNRPDLSRAILRFSLQGDTRSSADIATIHWDEARALCQLRLPGQKGRRKLDRGDCASIRWRIRKDWQALSLRSKAGFTALKRALEAGPHLPLAELEVAGLRLGVLRHATESCDVDMLRCKPISTDPADQLGFLVEKILEKNSEG